MSDGNSELLRAIFEKLEATENNLKGEIQGLKGEIQELSKFNEFIVEKCTKLEKTCEDQQRTILDLQKQINKKNIIIHGIIPDENEKSLESNVVKVLNEKLEMSLTTEKIEQVYRLGKNSENKNKPIKVEFVSYKDKMEVFKNRAMLKGTKIFINNDLPYELRIKEMEERKKKREVILSNQDLPNTREPIVAESPVASSQVREGPRQVGTSKQTTQAGSKNLETRGVITSYMLRERQKN